MQSPAQRKASNASPVFLSDARIQSKYIMSQTVRRMTKRNINILNNYELLGEKSKFKHKKLGKLQSLPHVLEDQDTNALPHLIAQRETDFLSIALLT